MKLYIKNMVCIRCKMKVKDELEKLDIRYSSVDYGEVSMNERIPADKLELLRAGLLTVGLELIDDHRSVLIQKIKNIVIELVHYSDEPLRINFSAFLSTKLDHNYTYLSNLFVEVAGTTIEKYIIAHKIERVKELIIYDEYNLKQISHLMHYSSTAHLSAQFKKITGFTPSHFRQIKDIRRTMLDQI